MTSADTPLLGRAALLATAAAVVGGALAVGAAVVAVELAVDRLRYWRHLRLPLSGTGQHVVMPVWPWRCTRCGWTWLDLCERPDPEVCR